MKNKILFLFVLCFSWSSFSFAQEVQREKHYKPFESSGVLFTLPISFYKQKYTLSCEITSLKMALEYKGVSVEEDELIKHLVWEEQKEPEFDTKKNRWVWGDPNKGFVGDIDGKMPITGYGVYEKPTHSIAEKYREAEIIEDANLVKVFKEIFKSNPVIVWGSLKEGTPLTWYDKDGNKIKAIEGEHARVLIGVKGQSSYIPTHVVLMDPIHGKIEMTIKDFIRDWGHLDNKALVIR